MSSEDDIKSLINRVNDSGNELIDVVAPVLMDHDIRPRAEPIEDNVKTDGPLTELLSNFGKKADDLLSNFDEDRAQLEEAIRLFRGQIDKAAETETRLPQVIFQSYVEVLKAKSNNNANATKVLDSIARFLQAGRGNEIFNSTGTAGGFSDSDLDELLKDG